MESTLLRLRPVVLPLAVVQQLEAERVLCVSASYNGEDGPLGVGVPW